MPTNSGAECAFISATEILETCYCNAKVSYDLPLGFFSIASNITLNTFKTCTEIIDHLKVNLFDESLDYTT